MSDIEEGARNVLTVGWCLLVGAGYLLAQLPAISAPSATAQPGQVLLQAVYLGFLALIVIFTGTEILRCRAGRHAGH